MSTASSILAQAVPSTQDINTQTETTEYDRYGWPINPATGKSYLFHELVEDTDLPLPLKDKGAVKRARQRAAGIQMQFKDSSTRESGKTKKSVNYAETMIDPTLDPNFVTIRAAGITAFMDRESGEVSYV